MTERGLDYVKSLPRKSGFKPLLKFIDSFPNPDSVAEEVRNLLQSGDSYVAPPEDFTAEPEERLFENWKFPVIAKTLYEVDKGRLLCLPPGSNRYTKFCKLIPTVMRRHREVNFPRLKSELANRPNLFFPGVFYPDEISIDNMEMISLHHGRNYVVQCDLSLEGLDKNKKIVLKPTQMGVESIITTLITELNRRMPANLQNTIGSIRVPSIVSVEESYGILEYIPGKNGVEILPNGIDTSSIHSLKRNEYPEDITISADEIFKIVDEFAKQAAMAFYLRLYDRKPDQMIVNKRSDQFEITHIDFGRGIKKNYALPWKRYYATNRAPLEFEDHEVPYFEAASCLIFLPHYIPKSHEDKYQPFQGRIRKRLKQCFTSMADFFQRNADIIRERLIYLVGEKTQFDKPQVLNINIEEEDIEEISDCLLSFDPSPDEVFDTILNLAQMERAGSTPTESVGSRNNDSVYRRSLRSGKDSRRLKPKYHGDRPYHMKDYNDGGQVYYDSDRQYLYMNFGSKPQRIIDYVHWFYSSQLAEFIEDFEEIQAGVTVKIFIDGNSIIRIPPGFIRRDVTFPEEAIREVRQVVKGFSPRHHVENYLDSFRSWKEDKPKVSFQEVEQKRQSLIFNNNLEGKEVLQIYALSKPKSHPLRDAISEIINHLLSNPDYLSDKDPIKSINDLVVHLGHKHEFIEPLSPEDDPIKHGSDQLFSQLFEIYNEKLKVGKFSDKTSQHVAHIRIMMELGQIISEILDLNSENHNILLTSIICHDLSILDPEFGSLLMNPNDRLDRPIMESYLKEHPKLSLRCFDELLNENKIQLSEQIKTSKMRNILKNHHSYRQNDDPLQDTQIHQILHIIDNFAVFADQSRPDEWDHGFIPLEELAPRWLHAEFERNHLSKPVYNAFNELLSEQYKSTRNRINNYTTTFLELFNALQLASALDSGIDPQNPDLFYELSNRHSENILKKVWNQITESNLPVNEKVKIFRRLDDLSVLFPQLSDKKFVFINATPRPIQRAVENIRKNLEDDRLIILMGLFPRVTKAFGRFLRNYGNNFSDSMDQIVAICGLRRLHFIRHSYPYEADFEVPFHRIIRHYRSKKSLGHDLCFIPFEKFYTGYNPTDEAESRVRKLEKASELEERIIPSKVKVEANRFLDWKSNHADIEIDELENERFRRIILNNFSNREVLHFYIKTLSENQNVKKALKEVIGALRENPNYLSERNSRYSLHEITRSLSQIHFFQNKEPESTSKLKDLSQKWEHNLSNAYIELLNENGSELNFYKDTLIRALNILDALYENRNTSPTPSMVISLLSAGLICKNEKFHDYFVSPEDISYNKNLRRRLMRSRFEISEKLYRTDVFQGLKKEHQVSIRKLIENCSPAREYGLIQMSLYMSFFLDFSRIENWERGRRKFLGEDFDHLSGPIKSVLSRFIPKTRTKSLISKLRNRSYSADIEFNQLSKSTFSYIYLFDALNLSSELRYGIFPGKISSIENVRQLYGVKRTNLIIEGIINSNLAFAEAIKIIRKVRFVAEALKSHPGQIEKLIFLNVDRTATWTYPEINRKHNSVKTFYILTGKINKIQNFIHKMQELNSNNNLKLHILVCEEFPLLLKETTLSITEYMRNRIKEFKNSENIRRNHFFMPAETLLRESPAISEKRRSEINCNPGTVFFKSWLNRFERDRSI